MDRRTALKACTALAAASLVERTASAEVKIERVIPRVGRNHGHELERPRAGTQIKVRSTEGDDHTHLVFVRHPIKKP